jgi:hypothetical protein
MDCQIKKYIWCFVKIKRFVEDTIFLGWWVVALLLFLEIFQNEGVSAGYSWKLTYCAE